MQSMRAAVSSQRVTAWAHLYARTHVLRTQLTQFGLQLLAQGLILFLLRVALGQSGAQLQHLLLLLREARVDTS